MLLVSESPPICSKFGTECEALNSVATRAVTTPLQGESARRGVSAPGFSPQPPHGLVRRWDARGIAEKRTMDGPRRDSRQDAATERCSDTPRIPPPSPNQNKPSPKKKRDPKAPSPYRS
ncbi:hypothetical protein GCM10028795_28910 [Lysobacter olei]